MYVHNTGKLSDSACGTQVHTTQESFVIVGVAHVYNTGVTVGVARMCVRMCNTGKFCDSGCGTYI